LLILNITGQTQRTAQHIRGDLGGGTDVVLVSAPNGDHFDPTEDARILRRLSHLAHNPNVGAVLILSAHSGETARVTSLLDQAGKPIKDLSLDECGRDIVHFTNKAVQLAQGLQLEIRDAQRLAFPMSSLTIGLQCGMSDPTSGIAANPLVGDFTDQHIAAGGTAIFSETMEWLGCEEPLASRAISPDVREDILSAVTRRERKAIEGGLDLMGKNPNAANIASGLTTIEDKAIGSMAKTGTQPIEACLGFGDRPVKPGLYAMDGPSYSPESLTGLAAAGAQIILFTTGAGNNYVSALCPTIKITGNGDTANRLAAQIDFDCSALVRDPAVQSKLIADLSDVVRVIASGDETAGEKLQQGDEVINCCGGSI
jgi:altronate dehydratase large subunit